jgi:hypothetical protein
MTVLKKSDIARPVRRKETVEVPELGGEVILQQMTLQLYVDFAVRGMTVTLPGGPDDAKAAGRARGTSPAPVLAACVLDADDQPIFDEAEWESWGMAHRDAAFRLYNRIRALSGMDVEQTAKN